MSTNATAGDTPDVFAPARRIADSILFEGYALYPYRASALKNQYRWMIGVLAPAAATSTAATEPPTQRTEVVWTGKADDAIQVLVRFLHVQQRRVVAIRDGRESAVDELDVAGRRYVSFDGATPREVHVETTIAELLDDPIGTTTTFAHDVNDVVLRDKSTVVGRIERMHHELCLTVRISARPQGAAHILTVDVTNETQWKGAADADRGHVVRQSPVATHVLLATSTDAFVSATAPGLQASAVAQCTPQGAWPVLIGAHGQGRIVLSAPVILPDNPQIAPQSQGDMFDGLEIEEMLALRIATLTDAEKVEAVATDPRAAAVIERFANVDAASLLPLHAIVTPPDESEWERALGSGAPGGIEIDIDGVPVAKGSRVRLRPNSGGDPQDRFFSGRAATVVDVYDDIDGGTHIAVEVDGDEAAALMPGRHRYFGTDEIEPLDTKGRDS